MKKRPRKICDSDDSDNENKLSKDVRKIQKDNSSKLLDIKSVFQNKILSTGKILTHWNDNNNLMKRTNNIINKFTTTGLDNIFSTENSNLSFDDWPLNFEDTSESIDSKDVSCDNLAINTVEDAVLPTTHVDQIVPPEESLLKQNLKTSVEQKIVSNENVANNQILKEEESAKRIFDNAFGSNNSSAPVFSSFNSWFSDLSSATKIAASSTVKKLTSNAQTLLNNTVGTADTSKPYTVSESNISMQKSFEEKNSPDDWEDDWDDEPVILRKTGESVNSVKSSLVLDVKSHNNESAVNIVDCVDSDNPCLKSYHEGVNFNDNNMISEFSADWEIQELHPTIDQDVFLTKDNDMRQVCEDVIESAVESNVSASQYSSFDNRNTTEVEENSSFGIIENLNDKCKNFEPENLPADDGWNDWDDDVIDNVPLIEETSKLSKFPENVQEVTFNSDSVLDIPVYQENQNISITNKVECEDFIEHKSQSDEVTIPVGTDIHRTTVNLVYQNNNLNIGNSPLQDVWNDNALVENILKEDVNLRNSVECQDITESNLHYDNVILPQIEEKFTKKTVNPICPCDGVKNHHDQCNNFEIKDSPEPNDWDEDSIIDNIIEANVEKQTIFESVPEIISIACNSQVKADEEMLEEIISDSFKSNVFSSQQTISEDSNNPEVLNEIADRTVNPIYPCNDHNTDCFNVEINDSPAQSGWDDYDSNIEIVLNTDESTKIQSTQSIENDFQNTDFIPVCNLNDQINFPATLNSVSNPSDILNEHEVFDDVMLNSKSIVFSSHQALLIDENKPEVEENISKKTVNLICPCDGVVHNHECYTLEIKDQPAQNDYDGNAVDDNILENISLCLKENSDQEVESANNLNFYNQSSMLDSKLCSTTVHEDILEQKSSLKEEYLPDVEEIIVEKSVNTVCPCDGLKIHDYEGCLAVKDLHVPDYLNKDSYVENIEVNLSSCIYENNQSQISQPLDAVPEICIQNYGSNVETSCAEQITTNFEIEDSSVLEGWDDWDSNIAVSNEHDLMLTNSVDCQDFTEPQTCSNDIRFSEFDENIVQDGWDDWGHNVVENNILASSKQDVCLTNSVECQVLSEPQAHSENVDLPEIEENIVKKTVNLICPCDGVNGHHHEFNSSQSLNEVKNSPVQNDFEDESIIGNIIEETSYFSEKIESQVSDSLETVPKGISFLDSDLNEDNFHIKEEIINFEMDNSLVLDGWDNSTDIRKDIVSKEQDICLTNNVECQNLPEPHLDNVGMSEVEENIVKKTVNLICPCDGVKGHDHHCDISEIKDSPDGWDDWDESDNFVENISSCIKDNVQLVQSLENVPEFDQVDLSNTTVPVLSESGIPDKQSLNEKIITETIMEKVLVSQQANLYDTNASEVEENIVKKTVNLVCPCDDLKHHKPEEDNLVVEESEAQDGWDADWDDEPIQLNKNDLENGISNQKFSNDVTSFSNEGWDNDFTDNTQENSIEIPTTVLFDQNVNVIPSNYVQHEVTFEKDWCDLNDISVNKLNPIQSSAFTENSIENVIDNSDVNISESTNLKVFQPMEVCDDNLNEAGDDGNYDPENISDKIENNFIESEIKTNEIESKIETSRVVDLSSETLKNKSDLPQVDLVSIEKDSEKIMNTSFTCPPKDSLSVKATREKSTNKPTDLNEFNLSEKLSKLNISTPKQANDATTLVDHKLKKESVSETLDKVDNKWDDWDEFPSKPTPKKTSAKIPNTTSKHLDKTEASQKNSSHKSKFNVIDNWNQDQCVNTGHKPNQKKSKFNVVSEDDWGNDWFDSKPTVSHKKPSGHKVETFSTNTFNETKNEPKVPNNSNRFTSQLSNAAKLSIQDISQPTNPIVQPTSNKSITNTASQDNSWFSSFRSATKTAAVTTMTHAVKNWSFNPTNLLDTVGMSKGKGQVHFTNNFIF